LGCLCCYGLRETKGKPLQSELDPKDLIKLKKIYEKRSWKEEEREMCETESLADLEGLYKETDDNNGMLVWKLQQIIFQVFLIVLSQTITIKYLNFSLI